MTKETKNKSKVDAKYSEDWVPISSISNGMIELEKGGFLTGVKIEPKNIFILDANAENNVIGNFRNLYNSIDYEFWLIVADRPVDIEVYKSQLLVEHSKQQNPAIRKILLQDIKKADAFGSTQYNVVDTDYYLLFRDMKVEILNKRLASIMTGLANCGLNSVQVSNHDLRSLLDNFYNDSAKVEFGMVVPE